MESLYEVWSRRNPEWETRYQESIMNVFTDYGRGSTQYQSVRGKYFGAGYEAFIIAFFIGLYFNQTKPLVDDKAKKKSFGQAIQYWGNQENRFGRSSYGQIRYYIFAALIARTDIDLIALDKGEIMFVRLSILSSIKWNSMLISVSLTCKRRWKWIQTISLKKRLSSMSSLLSSSPKWKVLMKIS